MRRFLWGLAVAVCATITPGAASAAFSMTILSAPAGYNGPTSAGPDPGLPDSIQFAFGELTFDRGRLTVTSSREQFATFASIGTTFQFKAATASGGDQVPAGTYTIRLRSDDFTLPPGTSGILGVLHTSIIPFSSPPGQPLVSTTATSSLIGGSSVSVNGSTEFTRRDEVFTTKPNGAYTLDQIVTVVLPAGGNGQFSVTTYVLTNAVPAPPAMLLGVLGLPLFGMAVRAWRRKGEVTPDVPLAA
ncbi:MAG: hypothetical protein ABGY75_19855 [Gemmataceae bacterium]